MSTKLDSQYEEFRSFADRGAAEALRSHLEFEGVPAYVLAVAANTQFAVCVLKKLAHRARWIAAQVPPTDAELEFLATGKLSGQEETK